jgi:tetratricopeptide (TPR) repeat protein
MCSENLGDVYSLMGEYEKSIESYEKQLSSAKKSNNLFSVLRSFSKLSKNYFYKNNAEKCIEYYQKHNALSYKLGNSFLCTINELPKFPNQN